MSPEQSIPQADKPAPQVAQPEEPPTVGEYRSRTERLGRTNIGAGDHPGPAGVITCTQPARATPHPRSQPRRGRLGSAKRVP